MSAGLLTLVQWLSPAFPTGGFAYSHGLEAAIAQEAVVDAPGLEAWLGVILSHGAGRQDGILLAQSLDALADHSALDAIARALQPSSERLSESLDQGTAFARTVAGLTGRDLAARCLPIAVGEAAAPLGMEPAQVVGLYLHAFTSNLVSVAMRFMPMGQAEGQGVLTRLHPLIEALANEVVTLGLEDLGTAAFGADLQAMQHETMDVRIFRT